MNITNQLPKNLEKTISDLARAREKAAKQKYLLDLSETLVMHLCSFVLGEYKEMGKVHIPLEKSFLQQKKNLGFGVYQGWLRESSKFLNQEKQPSEIHDLIHGSHDFLELSQFIKAYVALKSAVENNHENYMEQISQSLKNNLEKVNLYKFFDTFIQLRNRVAHPHKEVKGKVVTWPFSEEYFDAINPFLESGLNRVINELGKIWEFRQFVVDSNEQGVLTLISEDSNEPMEVTKTADYPEGIKVFAAKDTVLLSDWKLLLRAGEEAVEKIRQEEEELRNKATVEDLKESIKAALEDEQISLDELNFFESIGKTRMGLSKEQIKHLILEVAHKMGIEDPFPEVDKRFIEVVDHAITTKTYNEFLLKLTGQQYGVDNDTFDKVFLERTFALNVDPDEVRRNRVLQFTTEELNAFQGLMQAHKWLLDSSVFSRNAKESIFKINGKSDEFGTKEYFHRNAFSSLEHFVQSRLKKLTLEEDVEWATKQNNWQIGVMTSFAWCSIFPKNLPSKRLLSVHFTIYSGKWGLPGQASIGFMPDWKDYLDMKSYGLLKDVFSEHLISFASEYAEDLKQFPDLVLWDSLNNSNCYSFTESVEKFPWFYRYLYSMDQIQFVHTAQEILENPTVLIESFDISFNLFKGLFEAVNRDYLNRLKEEYVIETFEKTIRERLASIEPILVEFGLCESLDEGQDLTEVTSDEETPEVVEEVISTDGLRGGVQLGHFSREIKKKIKGYPLAVSFIVKQDYLNNKLNYLIYVSCAGYLESDVHLPIERVLNELQELQYNNATFHFKRSKFLVVAPIDDIETFEPIAITRFFLDALATKCAKNMTSFAGLRISNPLIYSLHNELSSSLDSLALSLKTRLSVAIKMERNWMRGGRYLDSIACSKSSCAWLGWGFEYSDNNLFAGVILHLNDSIKGALTNDAFEKFAQENSTWQLKELGATDVADPEWILKDATLFKLSASTEHSKPHTAEHALMSNKKTYWAAKVKDDQQWWQMEAKQAMVFTKLKLAGAPAGNSYMQEFNLSYSLDGQVWESMECLEGLNNGDEIKDIELNQPIIARFIKIHPTKYIGWPGFRINFLAVKVLPSKVELQWLVPVKSSEDLNAAMTQVEVKINEVKKIELLGI